MPSSNSLVTLLNAALAVFVAVMFFIPVYIAFSGLHESADEDFSPETIVLTPEETHTCLDPPYVSPTNDRPNNQEEEQRLIAALTNLQTKCDHLVLPGTPNHALSTDHEDLRWNSYVCIGGKTGLTKNNCLIYSFGIKHLWEKFPSKVEMDLGCQVFGFDPGLDYIDHYRTAKVRFFNARLYDKDQQAQYRISGPPGWKYRTFLTLIKELHFSDEPIDHVRLDITADLWQGISTMLKDGSLLTYAKQLSFEYDLNKKNVTQNREIFTITQWLNKQGFLLAHSQPTKLSGKSYSVVYVNTKMNDAR
ncbi:uncharacterized protein LOC114524022 [Dendronephthya gigantea]|uniref:uncharacterized protein LOC114524022 n=1 Tax=Dendronephthya gigantea TaxID=151771 RepID=UPI00106D8961|nr:uncharacterized protein LOC114524022 [Dendronephthya gigantea]